MVVSYKNMTDAQIEEYRIKSMIEADEKEKAFKKRFGKNGGRDNNAAFNTITYNCAFDAKCHNFM